MNFRYFAVNGVHGYEASKHAAHFIFHKEKNAFFFLL